LVVYFNKELNILARNKFRGSEMHTADSKTCGQTCKELLISFGKVRHRSNYSGTIPARRQDIVLKVIETYRLSFE